jgi:truncated hemoglobin YjbI
MRIKIKDKNRMRDFINKNTTEKISDEDFQEWLSYLQDTANFIEETEKVEGMIERVREGASLTLTVDDKEYEVMVKFNRLVDEDGIYFSIDINYDYFEEI